MTLTDERPRQLHRDRLRPRAVVAGSRRVAGDVVERPPRWHRGHFAILRRRLIRPGAATLVVLAVVAVMAASIGAYVAWAAEEPPTQHYAVTSPADQWLQAPVPATVSWFRADVDLPAAPTSGVLWIDARDMYRVWVNGRVAATNRAAARAGAAPVGDAVDVRSLLKAGTNVIAVQATALGEDTAAVWARLKAATPAGPVDVGTDSDRWRVTADPSATDSALGRPPGFIEAGAPTGTWPAPAQLTPVRRVVIPAPDPLLEAPAVTALSVRGFDAVYRLSATLPESTADGWLQVAATGALTVSVNGVPVAEEPAPPYQSPNSHRPARLLTFQLGAGLHGGENELVFHVTGSESTSLAVGGLAGTPDGWVPIAGLDQRWTVHALGAPMSVTPMTAQELSTAWPNGFTAVVEAPAAEPGSWFRIAATVLPFWLVAMALLVAAAVAAGRAARVMLGRVALCLAPACALILAALGYGRWITVEPGFAASPSVVAFVCAAVVLPALGLAVLTWASRRAWRRPPGGTTPAAGVSSASRVSAVARRLGAWRPGRRMTTRARSLRMPFGVPGQRAAVVVIAAVAGLAQGWRIGRQPLWQDEVTSIVVARQIAEHGLPQLDSGLYYFKAELFHYLLAVVVTITDNPDVLRAVSLVWFVATVLAFGLLLMPVLTRRPGLQVLATAVFVLLPAELAWAREVRMYQMMQFFAVVFLALFIRSLQHGKTRDIVGSAGALAAMYLSHENSFVLLPALPLLALIAWRVVWARRRVFLLAFAPVGVLIALQYLVSRIHPPDFGEDLSNRPYVGWDPDQADFYYQRVFFSPLAQAGSLAIVSTLAIVAMIVGLRRRDRATILAGTALFVTVPVISLVFTAKVDRYSFVVVPLLVALAVQGAALLVGALASWRAGLTAPAGSTGSAAGPRHAASPARPRVGAQPERANRWLRGTAVTTVVIAMVAVATTLVVTPRAFGLWAADLTGSPNPLSHPDYGSTVQYVVDHRQPGDVVITLAPPVMATQHLGTLPDRVIQTGRNKLLYLVLEDGRAVDTILGVRVLLTGEHIRTYLQEHRRVWLVSDTGSYIQGVPPDVRAEVSRSFLVVAQDAAATVSLWDAG